MGHGRKKRKIAFILIAAGAALLALVLIYTLLGDLRDGRKPEKWLTTPRLWNGWRVK